MMVADLLSNLIVTLCTQFMIYFSAPGIYMATMLKFSKKINFFLSLSLLHFYRIGSMILNHISLLLLFSICMQFILFLLFMLSISLYCHKYVLCVYLLLFFLLGCIRFRTLFFFSWTIIAISNYNRNFMLMCFFKTLVYFVFVLRLKERERERKTRIEMQEEEKVNARKPNEMKYKKKSWDRSCRFRAFI